ncbi:MAG: OmpA family protein [Saprospiraceae bacterium]|nr:OmpA family protein [Saprospiraceae bacterium]
MSGFGLIRGQGRFECVLALFLLIWFYNSGLTQEDPIGVDDFVLAGDAIAMGDECVQLTPAYDWSSGSAWYRDAIDMSLSFAMEMDVMFGCDDVGGADGIVFAFAPFRGTGRPGEGMGFSGMQPSLGIEIDTWENEHLEDPPEDHIALLQHGYVHHFYNLKGPIIIPNVENCQLHSLHITWDHVKKFLSVALDGKEVLTFQTDIVNHIFDGESKLYWGVTAATGRYNNQHQICFRKLEFAKPLAMYRFHPREEKLLLKGNLTQSELTFSDGKYEIGDQHISEINKILNLLQAHPQFEIDIDGHTDELGNARDNQILSTKRVESIGAYLMSKGIAKDRIHMSGYGQKYPVDRNLEQNKFKKNRRIDIRFFNPRT